MPLPVVWLLGFPLLVAVWWSLDAWIVRGEMPLAAAVIPQVVLLINLLAEDHSRADADGRHHVLLEPYGYRWYRVGGLDYLLKRSEV